MNWITGTTDYFAADTFKGMEMAYPELWQTFSIEKNSASLIRRYPSFDKVAIIISGGAGVGPLFPGFVSEGLADAVVVGAPYSAPSAYTIFETGMHLGKNRGVCLLYNSFAGDFLNNDMAHELLELNGISVESVAVTDDIGTAIGEPKENRNGRIGIAWLMKVASFYAESGMDLDVVASKLRDANKRLAALSVYIDVIQNKVIYGKGISGEPGFASSINIDMKQVATEALGYILDDLKPGPGEKLLLLINRLGCMSYSDSFIFTKYALEELSKQHTVLKTRVAGFFNILDVYGFDISILCVDEKLEECFTNNSYTESFIL